MNYIWHTVHQRQLLVKMFCKKSCTKIKQSQSKCFPPSLPRVKLYLVPAKHNVCSWNTAGRIFLSTDQNDDEHLVLFMTYTQVVSNTFATCHTQLSRGSEWDGWKLHHASSSSHITSDWKIITTVTEVKHGIHSKPQTRTAVSALFLDWLANLALELEPLEDKEIVHLLRWWFPCHLISTGKHCSPKQKETQLWRSNPSISAHGFHSCSDSRHMAPLKLLPTETWKFTKIWFYCRVPS